jgi:hypothetical protein
MALPDFVVAGVARAGTTTLYDLLKKNSQIFLPNIKETNFFSDANSKNKEDYIIPKDDKFYHTKLLTEWQDYKRLYANAGRHQLKGDISPSYMWDVKSAERIKARNKDAKIIISLRSPVDRALSHYKMNFYIGFEKEKQVLKALNKPYDGYWGGGNCYLKCSYYYELIKAYYEHFDKDQILILIYEDWISDQSAALKSISDFLGIDYLEGDIDISEHKNEVHSLKNRRLLNLLRSQKAKKVVKKLLDEETINRIKGKFFVGGKSNISLSHKEEEELKALFREDVMKCQKLINKDLLNLWKFQ